MKPTSIALFALIAITTFLHAEEPVEKPTFKVHFQADILDRRSTPPTPLDCQNMDILKKREAPNPVDPPISTLALNKNTSTEPDTFEYCEDVFSNLTNLDQTSVKDDLASILEEIPCQPGADIYIMLATENRPSIRRTHPGIKHTQIVNKIDIGGCLEDLPPLCSLPSTFTRWDADDVLIEYKDLMHAFKRCHFSRRPSRSTFSMTASLHLALAAQQATLAKKLQGHYGYYGVTGNARSLHRFREAVREQWRKWLGRRTRRRNSMTWEKFDRLWKDHYPLPVVRIVHSIYAAKPFYGGTGCVNGARPDLWGERAVNPPALPGLGRYAPGTDRATGRCR